MSDLAVQKIMVRRGAPEPVHENILDVYRWLGGRLTQEPVRLIPPKHTIYVTSEEFHSRKFEIHRHLTGELPVGRGTRYLILDLTGNPYSLLGESLLYHIAVIAQEWIASAPRRVLAILVPKRPPETSAFWIPLRSHGESVTRAGKIVVIADDGSCEWAHGGTEGLGHGFSEEYAVHRAPSDESLKHRLETKVIRRLGHYDFGNRDIPHCSRYFFDMGQAVEEIGMMAIRWLKKQLAPPLVDPKGLTLISVESGTTYLHDAIAGVATALGCAWRRVKSSEQVNSLEITGTAVLFFNVIHTGRTYENVVRLLRGRGVELAPRALAVIITDQSLDMSGGPLPCDELTRVSRAKVSRENCEQCRIGLKHTDPLKDHLQALRSYDVWNIFLGSRWRPEEFGPHDADTFFSYHPDMGHVFEQYGDWIALKAISLSRALGEQLDPIFVCPEEERIEKLVVKLGVLMENRQITVRIPRDVLDDADSEERLMAAADEDWQRQLRHLGTRRKKALILDEFRAHGTTARAIRSVLRRFGVEPIAFVPVLDFSDEQDLDGLPVYPLYKIRARRSGL